MKKIGFIMVLVFLWVCVVSSSAFGAKGKGKAGTPDDPDLPPDPALVEIELGELVLHGANNHTIDIGSAAFFQTQQGAFMELFLEGVKQGGFPIIQPLFLQVEVSCQEPGKFTSKPLLFSGNFLLQIPPLPMDPTVEPEANTIVLPYDLATCSGPVVTLFKGKLSFINGQNGQFKIGQRQTFGVSRIQILNPF
ncbi:MAG: hypothetical protein ACE5ER_01665 [Nitrospinaceae bacterium]